MNIKINIGGILITVDLEKFRNIPYFDSYLSGRWEVPEIIDLNERSFIAFSCLIEFINEHIDITQIDSEIKEELKYYGLIFNDDDDNTEIIKDNCEIVTEYNIRKELLACMNTGISHFWQQQFNKYNSINLFNNIIINDNNWRFTYIKGYDTIDFNYHVNNMYSFKIPHDYDLFIPRFLIVKLESSDKFTLKKFASCDIIDSISVHWTSNIITHLTSEFILTEYFIWSSITDVDAMLDLSYNERTNVKILRIPLPFNRHDPNINYIWHGFLNNGEHTSYHDNFRIVVKFKPTNTIVEENIEIKIKSVKLLIETVHLSSHICDEIHKIIYNQNFLKFYSHNLFSITSQGRSVITFKESFNNIYRYFVFICRDENGNFIDCIKYINIILNEYSKLICNITENTLKYDMPLQCCNKKAPKGFYYLSHGNHTRVSEEINTLIDWSLITNPIINIHLHQAAVPKKIKISIIAEYPNAYRYHLGNIHSILA